MSVVSADWSAAVETLTDEDGAIWGSLNELETLRLELRTTGVGTILNGLSFRVSKSWR